MKSTKQLIAIGLIAAGSWANGQSGLAPTTVSANVPSAGGGRGGAIGGTTATRAVAPVTSAKIYAQNALGDYNAAYGYVSRSSGSSVPPVVIQFGSKGPEAIAAMEEDLAVMTHIIDRALDRLGVDTPDEKMGIRLYYTSGGKSVRALYLENFGPLFMVKVNFPVHAPVVTETKAPEQPDDSEWNEALRSVRGYPDDTRWGGTSGGARYEAEWVEALKKQLIAALKNASNMKGVKPEEYVTVTVFGSPAVVDSELPREWKSSSVSKRGAGQATATRFAAVAMRNDAQPENARLASQGTVLTLRIRKSDIDAAGKDGMDALAKKAQVNTYAGNGHGLSSVNSWIRSSSSSGLAR